MITFKGKLVEVSEVGEYQGSPYASLKLRTETARGQEIVKFKVDTKTVDHASLLKLLDFDVVVSCNLVKGLGDVANLKAFAVAK